MPSIQRDPRVANAAHTARGPICWACGEIAPRPRVKVRYERPVGGGRAKRGFGAYHHNCKARDDRA